MCVIRALTLALSLVVCSLFAFVSGARANCDRHQRRHRAAAVAGLRSAADTNARLFVGARLLGLGRRHRLLLGARNMGLAAGA